MEYTFSDRVSNLKPSAIREIFKYAADPSVVSLSAGNPSPDAFPAKAIEEISARVLRENPISVLQYSVTEGYTPLRQHMLDYMKREHNTGSDADDILITTGAQQIMDLCTKALVNEGEVVLVEAPSFIGSLNTFRSYNAKLVGVTVEPDGMSMTELEEKLKANPNAKFIYTIPNFQNPSGVTMSLEKRKKMYALAKEYGVLILEDNPYGDLRYSGENLPNIKSMDTEGRVIYSRTFSKILAPGLRVGYVSAPAEIISKMVVCKQVADVHTNIWAQQVCDRFMETTDMNEHLASLRKVYRRKFTLMETGIKEHFDPSVKVTEPEGGLFIWATLPESIDMMKFCKVAVEQYKVAVVPGTAFMINETDKTNSFRLNFSTPSDEQIVRGCEILGKLTKEKF